MAEKQWRTIPVAAWREMEKIEEAKQRKKLDRLIDSATRRVRATWIKLGSPQSREEHYGEHKKLLKYIYTLYSGWRVPTNTIRMRLAERLRLQSVSPTPHVLTLLIMEAIPEVKPNVVAIWVDAIRCGESRGIQPAYKLGAFLFGNGGPERCARLFRAEQEERRREKEENARQYAEERKEAARRERLRRRIPPGFKLLFFDR